MDSKEKVLQKAKNLFEKLKTDPKRPLFSEKKKKKEKQLLKKLKKSTYDKDHLLLKLINISEQIISDKNIPPTRADYIEKREIDRFTLYSLDGPFQLTHADVGNLQFLEKNATASRYVLLVVELYSSKVYVYPICSRKQILQKMGQLYNEIKHKRKKKSIRLQVDNEFQQVKIKDLNEQNHVEMFSTAVRSGKAFAAEQKIRGLKSRVAKLNALKMKVTPTKIILSSVENMNNVVSKKYGISPNDIEKKFLASKTFRTLFNFHRIVQRKRYTINSINTIEKNTNQKRKSCTKLWRLVKRY